MPFSCNVPALPTCSQCAPPVAGRVVAVALVPSDFVFVDHTDFAEWLTAECNEDIRVVRFTRGTKTSSPVTSPGFGGLETIVTGRTHTLTFSEPNIDNCAMWNAFQQVLNARVYYMTLSGHVYSSENAVSIEWDNPIEEATTSQVQNTINMTFSQLDNPCPISVVPADLTAAKLYFENCQECGG